MVSLNINNVDYELFESWSEVTLKKARELAVVLKSIPEELAFIYNEQSKGDDADKDQITIYTKKLESITDQTDKFFIDVIELMSDIPKQVLLDSYIVDIRGLYHVYLTDFVFGALHYPLEKVKHISSFKSMGVTYYAPKSKKVMNVIRPFHLEDAAVFCDASDIDSNSRNQGTRYDYAELIIAIVFRKKGEEYTEKESLDRADVFMDILTCDIYHAAISHLSAVNSALKLLFPNLYERGDAKASMASSESGLADFGWFNSILTVSELGHFNKHGLTNLDAARTANLYDMMTVLSNIRANSDFQRIFREKHKK